MTMMMQSSSASASASPMNEPATNEKQQQQNHDLLLLDAIVQVAEDAARKAGAIILEHYSHPPAGIITATAAANTAASSDTAATNTTFSLETQSKGANPRDLLTRVDPLCERIIRETILSQFPNHAFLGEESVAPGKEASATALAQQLLLQSTPSSSSSSSSQQQNSEDHHDPDHGAGQWLWIVDPIDGTTNFVHGMPLCMPSIAATCNGQVMVGVIYDCHRDELFTAMKGRGAFLKNNEKALPLSLLPRAANVAESQSPSPSQLLSQQTTLQDAVIAMGSPPGLESMTMSIKGVAALMPKVRTIRMLGSAALMLAWVACGRLSCYWEYDLSAWDVAAGALLVTEAGGRFTDLQGNDYQLSNRKICASNNCHVHDAVLAVLNEAGIR